MMIKVEDKLITNPAEVAESMNNFYTNIANTIGNDKNLPNVKDFNSTSDFVNACIIYHKDNPSIKDIANNQADPTNFTFQEVTPEEVKVVIGKLNPKKATGVDGIPAKILKEAEDILSPHFANIYNQSVRTCTFPSGAKAAEVLPIYKKADALERKNHRPVSILTSSSKILEKLMFNQMTESLLLKIYNAGLSALQAGYSCQNGLLNLCYTWRGALEGNNHIGL